jgi:hypothetical protein
LLQADVSVAEKADGVRALDAREYYSAVFDRLLNCFDRSHYVVATGREIGEEGLDPAFPSIAEPVERLSDLARERALELHLPVVGEKSRSVLMPVDVELFLAQHNHRIYSSRASQRELLADVIPVIRFLEDLLRSRGIPYLLDYTPSGGHILFYTDVESRAGRALQAIGFVEEDLAEACSYTDPHDIRRWFGTSFEAARVFSGLAKLAEYAALLAMEAFRENEARGSLPVTIGDSHTRCINIDNSWSEGSPFMRCIRSPFSLHRKNRDRHGLSAPPLVDIVGCSFDGENAVEERNLDAVLDCMWDLSAAARHAERFSGQIPCAGDALIELVEDYRASELFSFHRQFEAEPPLPRGQALARARTTHGLSPATRQVLTAPNPAALQPRRLIRLVREFFLGARWKPRHVGNILRDLYEDPSFGWSWDFFRYPSDAKANYWARCYAAIALWAEGQLRV